MVSVSVSVSDFKGLGLGRVVSVSNGQVSVSVLVSNDEVSVLVLVSDYEAETPSLLLAGGSTFIENQMVSSADNQGGRWGG